MFSTYVLIHKQGKLLVKEEDRVTFGQVIGHEENQPSSIRLNLAELLVISPKKTAKSLIKKSGDLIKANQIIAKTKTFLGLKKKLLKSPCDGSLVKIVSESGEISIDPPIVKKEIKSPIDGKIKKISDQEVTISFNGRLIDLEEAVGQLEKGELMIIDDIHSHLSLITKACCNKIIACLSWRKDALEKVFALGVKAVIGVSFPQINFKDLKTKIVSFGNQEEKLFFNAGRINQENFLLLKNYQAKESVFDPVNKKLIVIS